VQVNNNGVAVVGCMVSRYDMSDYVHNNFPQARAFYYETPRRQEMVAPTGLFYPQPTPKPKRKPDDPFDGDSKIFFKSSNPDEIANLVVKDVNIIKYDFPQEVTEYQKNRMQALGLKIGPIYIDEPLTVAQMIQGGHILVIDNIIYVIKPTKSGHAFVFANAEMAQFIFDKVSRL